MFDLVCKQRKLIKAIKKKMEDEEIEQKAKPFVLMIIAGGEDLSVAKC